MEQTIGEQFVKHAVEKLLSVQAVHGQIIVGVDFDDTIFSFDHKFANVSDHIIELLKELRDENLIRISLYTISNDVSLYYKKALMRCWGISADYVDESPVKFKAQATQKPYFNLLLDDKAGLHQAIEILEKYRNNLLV